MTLRPLRAWLGSKPLVVGVLLATGGLAAAAVTITYANPSTLTTSVTPPPIQLAAGDDSALGDYVTAYAISANRTYLTTTVKGVPEASLAVGSFFKLQNVDDASHGVTLSTANVTNSLVTAYTLEIYDGSSALQTTLNLRAATANPSATFTIPAGQTWSVKLTLTLATTAGADNVALTNGVTLAVA